MKRVFAASVAAVLFLGTSIPAGAQSDDPGSASRKAIELFNRGRALVAQGDCAKAIPLFQASLASEKTVGALLNLGECSAQSGQPLVAWRTFKEAERLAAEKNDERSIEARKRAAGVEPFLFKFTAAIEGEGGGITFTLDGTPVETKSVLEGLCIEPGKHELSATRGEAVWRRSLEGAPGASTAVSVTFASPSAAPEPSEKRVPPELAHSPQKTIGLVVGGAGILAIGAGAFFGVRTIGDVHDAKSACGPTYPNRCTDYAKTNDAQGAARTDGMLSTIFFIVGGTAAVGGAVLFFTAPKEGHLVPRVSTRAATLSWEGAW